MQISILDFQWGAGCLDGHVRFGEQGGGDPSLPSYATERCACALMPVPGDHRGPRACPRALPPTRCRCQYRPDRPGCSRRSCVDGLNRKAPSGLRLDKEDEAGQHAGRLQPALAVMLSAASHAPRAHITCSVQLNADATRLLTACRRARVAFCLFSGLNIALALIARFSPLHGRVVYRVCGCGGVQIS